jgi:hypothetical protein
LVDLVGIEPTTSSMPWKRAPSCATGPRENTPALYEGSKHFNSRLPAIDSQTPKSLVASLNRAVHFAKARKLSILMDARGSP